MPSNEKVFGIIATSVIVSLLVVSGFAMGTTGEFLDGHKFGNDGDQHDDDDDKDTLQAISWIAFCSQTGLTSENVTHLEENETNLDDDPISVDWETNANVDIIIIKYATTVEVFEVGDEMMGTVKVGEGLYTEPSDAFTGQNYCTGVDEDLSGAKFDWGGSSTPFFYNGHVDFWDTSV